MTSTFMTSLFLFRHDISVFQTWHLHLWHQCFFRHDIYIDDISVFHKTSTFMTSVFFRPDIYIYNISVFHMTSTLLTSVFFRHDIYIHDFSVFKIWHRKFMTSVHFTWYLHWWHQCFSPDIDMHDIYVFLTWHQCISNTIYINDISAFQLTSSFINISAFSDMPSTFMTSVFFRHDIYIHDISVFPTWHLHLWHQCFSHMTSTLMT